MDESVGGSSTESLATGLPGTAGWAPETGSSVGPPNPRKSPAFRTVLLYAQDSKGMGHVTRTLTIARHLLAAYPNIVAYIATESPITSELALPSRCDYVKLPTHWLSWADHEEVTEHLSDDRARLLREIALRLSPDLVIVDHEPVGHKGEFRAGLFALKAQCPSTKFVFGLRDIMDDAGRIRAQWQALGVYEALETVYDGIAVFGERGVYDIADACALPPSIRSKLHYCGYIVREPPRVDGAKVRQQYCLSQDGPLVVATVGGGSDGYPVLAATLDALDRLQAAHPALKAILVAGPLMAAGQQAALRARATPDRRIVSRADNFGLVSAADAVVSMGGYNSVCEALFAGKPLVIIPRVVNKVEQQIRAQTMAANGLARWVHPMDLNGKNLAEALDWALRRNQDVHARRVREVIPSFDGASQLTAYLAQWLENGHDRLSPPKELLSVDQAA
jgi:predicted glycosyltransferase